MKTISICWEGPFSPADVLGTDMPAFLRREADSSDLDDEVVDLYLVYYIIGVEWKLLYVGAKA